MLRNCELVPERTSRTITRNPPVRGYILCVRSSRCRGHRKSSCWIPTPMRRGSWSMASSARGCEACAGEHRADRPCADLGVAIVGGHDDGATELIRRTRGGARRARPRRPHRVRRAPGASASPRRSPRPTARRRARAGAVPPPRCRDGRPHPRGRARRAPRPPRRQPGRDLRRVHARAPRRSPRIWLPQQPGSSRTLIREAAPAAEVRFYRGEVTSAQVGLIHGQAALHQLLLWTDARFDYHHEDIVRRQQIPLPSAELFADAQRFLEGVRDSAGRLSPAMVLEQDVARVHQLGKQIPTEVHGVLRMFDGHRVLADVLEDSPYRVFETLRVAQRAIDAGLLRTTAATRPKATWRTVLAIEDWLIGSDGSSDGVVVSEASTIERRADPGAGRCHGAGAGEGLAQEAQEAPREHAAQGRAGDRRYAAGDLRHRLGPTGATCRRRGGRPAVGSGAGDARLRGDLAARCPRGKMPRRQASRTADRRW